MVERKEENGKRFTVIVLGEETGNDKYELGIFLGWNKNRHHIQYHVSVIQKTNVVGVVE